MNMELRPLHESGEEIFVRENQIAFDQAAIEESGSKWQEVSAAAGLGPPVEI